MDAALIIIAVVVGLLLGAVVAWLVLRAGRRAAGAVASAEATQAAERARAEAEQSRAETERSRAEAERTKADAERVRAEAERARADLEHLRSTVADTRTELAEAKQEAALAREEAADARAALAAEQARVDAARAEAAAAQESAKVLAADRESLVAQFKVLSQETIDRQHQQSEATAAERLRATERVMGPMTQALQVFQDRLTAVEKERAALHTELKGEVRAVQRTGDELRRETSALANALRKPQVRGAWGETQLRRVAEMAGMIDRCDFLEQHSVRGEEGLFRPDMTVQLSDGKQIFVDSKVPLSAWLDAGDTDDETARAQFISTFGRTVRSHVDQLGGKNYWRMAEQLSPDFVVLFLPGENFLQAALEGQPDLYEYAVKRNVVIATPNTLIALLRTVALGWRQAALATSAKEVFELGRELHERLATMGTHLGGLGKALERSVKSYNETVASMEKRVLVTARKFETLDISSQELPQPEQIGSQVRSLTAPELSGNELPTAQPDATELPAAEQELLRLGPGPELSELAVEGTLLPLERRRA